MNSMRHQGYTARVECDERDHIFVGRILGIRAIISFHGQSVKELRKEFEHAIDDYLAECAEKAVSPENSASGKLLLRVAPGGAWSRQGCRPGIRQKPEPVGGGNAGTGRRR